MTQVFKALSKLIDLIELAQLGTGAFITGVVIVILGAAAGCGSGDDSIDND